MSKEKIISIVSQIAIVAAGTIVGVSLLDLSKRLFLKNQFDKPLDVNIEEE